MLLNRSLRYAALALLLFLESACTDFPAPHRGHSLDYLEIYDPAGWILRIDGDGGGRLRWRKLPRRWAIYLPETFRLRKAARRVADCQKEVKIISPSCTRVVYYHQNNNETHVCNCPDGKWIKGYFDLAFAELRNSSGTKKDQRLLHRAWLSDPPNATLKSL